jgi:hypothetical protein
MPQVTIDWASAQVRSRELSVALSDGADKQWRARFSALVQRLERPGEPWGAIKVDKRQITVTDVEQGAESELRHFIESAALEANAPEAAAERDDEHADDESDDDGQMTRAFQGFAGDEPG